jgi:hypothetical protein
VEAWLSRLREYADMNIFKHYGLRSDFAGFYTGGRGAAVRSTTLRLQTPKPECNALAYTLLKVPSAFYKS